MQSKGAIRFVTIVLAIACIYQLSFTAVSGILEKKAQNYAESKAEAFDLSNVALEDQAYVLDSVKKYETRWYTDSISTEKVFFGLTYKDVKAKEISLGLDLKGGMNVMLQVQLEDLVVALSDNSQDPDFLKALEVARQKDKTERGDFISHFEAAWKEVAPGKRLSQIFGTYEMRDRIKPESTDEQVIAVIRADADAAIANSFNVLRNRIDRFGVASPSIQRIGNTGRILVELPGVKEPERVRKLLQGTASLEFWTTYENSEIYPFLLEANEALRKYSESETPAEKKAAESVLESEIAAQNTNAELENYKKANPLFSVLQPSNSQRGACIGYANAADTARVNALLRSTKDLFPVEFRPMWSVKPVSGIGADNIFELVAIKASTHDGKAPLDGDVVTDARVSYDSQ
ncbi:MAG: protein translocase subunit SecDF, partial [Candidatus Cryptobacteroides sp.]